MQTKPARQRPDPLSDYRLWERHGLMGWWLNLTAPPPPALGASIQQKEHIRKAELTSVSMLAVFACLLALLSNSLVDPSTAEGTGTLAGAILIAAILNRTGHTRLAAYLVPGALMVIIGVNVLQESLELIDLPIYDLFAIPIILVSLVADRRAPWAFAAVAIAFVVGSYSLESHVVLTLRPGLSFDGLAYEQNIYGVWGMVNRHIILLFFAALLGWIGSRSVEIAIQRADNSDKMAALEARVAQEQRELKEALHSFLDEVYEAHRAQANGLTPRPLAERPAIAEFDFNDYVRLFNERLKWFERRRQDHDFMMEHKIAQAVLNLTARLESYRTRGNSFRELQPTQAKTEVEVVDQLYEQIYLLLLQQGNGTQREAARPRPSAHIQPFSTQTNTHLAVREVLNRLEQMQKQPLPVSALRTNVPIVDELVARLLGSYAQGALR